MKQYARKNLGNDSSGRPLVVDARTELMLDIAATDAGVADKLVIVQGSYRAGNGAQASAGTHDGGGVVDLRTWNLTPEERDRLLWALRCVGFAAWYRTKEQGFDPHIHAVDCGNKRLHPSARDQVTAYRAGRNGLASNGPDDFRRPDPLPVFRIRPYRENQRIDALLERAIAVRDSIKNRPVTERRLRRAIKNIRRAEKG